MKISLHPGASAGRSKGGGETVDVRRFICKGEKERLPQIEAALDKKNMDRRTMYLILKYFEINPECEETLKREFPDV